MSRIGNRRLSLPSEVEFKDTGKALIFSKDGKTREIVYDSKIVGVKLENSELVFERKNSSKFSNMLQGTLNSLSLGAIIGLTKGFEKKLLIEGVGYRATKKDKVLVLALGYSKEINLDIPEEVQLEASSNGKELVLKSFHKEILGEFAALIKKQRPVEPYKGKGIRIDGEVVVRKQGKSSEKAKK